MQERESVNKDRNHLEVKHLSKELFAYFVPPHEEQDVLSCNDPRTSKSRTLAGLMQLSGQIHNVS